MPSERRELANQPFIIALASDDAATALAAHWIRLDALFLLLDTEPTVPDFLKIGVGFSAGELSRVILEDFDEPELLQHYLNNDLQPGAMIDLMREELAASSTTFIKEVLRETAAMLKRCSFEIEATQDVQALARLGPDALGNLG